VHDSAAHEADVPAQRVQEVMCRQMEEVLVGDIPAACEASLSDRWHKKAKLLVRDGKVYPWKPSPAGDSTPASAGGAPENPGPPTAQAAEEVRVHGPR
jgi:hypothetical protein